MSRHYPAGEPNLGLKFAKVAKPKPLRVSGRKTGAGEGIRTLDPNLGKGSIVSNRVSRRTTNAYKIATYLLDCPGN